MSSVPSEVGGYRVERELGRGGMGAVYLAHDPQMGRRVAVKVLLHELTDPEHTRRFQAEAEAVARLSHPGIVGVHQVGMDRGNPFIVLDYVEGETLEDRLQRTGALPPAEAAALTAELADAVAHAHERGILHRDLKPANVILDAAGKPRLTDFGLARELSAERERLTQTGEVLGTPSYMAPEQAGGEGEVGPATDVYGLGSILYRLLTGEPPFRAPTLINLLQKVLVAPAQPPSASRAEVPKALDRIALRALEKDPARRFESAQALAEALRGFENTAERGPRWGLLAAGAAVVLGGVAVAAGIGPNSEPSPTAVASRSPTATASPTSTPSPGPTAASPTPTATASPDAPWAPGPIEMGAQPVGQRPYEQLAGFSPLLGFKRFCVQLDAKARLRGAFMAGGRYLVLGPGRSDRTREATLYDTRDWKVVERWSATRAFRSFATAGPWLARLRQGRIELLRSVDGKVSPVASWTQAPSGEPQVTAVGRDGRVAVGYRTGRLDLYPRGSLQAVTLRQAGLRVLGLRFYGDRLYVGLAAYGGKEGLAMWDTRAPNGPPTLYAPKGPTGRLAVSPDGRSVVAVTTDGLAFRYVQEPKELRPVGRPVQLFPVNRGEDRRKVSYLRFTPDGKRLLASSRDARKLKWWRWKARGWGKGETAHLSYQPTQIDISADGRYLFVMGIVSAQRGVSTVAEVWAKDPE